MIRRIFLLVAWAIVPMTAAISAERFADLPRLKPSAMVVGEVVRIGDLVENAGAMADVPIFRSPDVGSTGIVSAAKVLNAIGQHDLLIVDAAGINQIEITRNSRVIPISDIEKRIARTFGGQFGLGEPTKLTVSFDREPRPIYAEPDVTADLQVVRSYYEPRTSRFDVTLSLPGSSIARGSVLRYVGSIMEMVEVPVLTRQLNRGEVIRDADVSIERKPRTDVPSDAWTAPDTVVGLAARQILRAGVPLRRSELVRPEIIKRDETVTISYEVPGILLTARGKAIEGGADGDVINVLNIQSKRTVQGIVSGPGRVTIASTTPISATRTAAISRDAVPDQSE